MSLTAEDRKSLSMMGAVRIPRDRFLAYVRGKGSTQCIWPILVNMKVGTQQNSLGYIAYKDMGNAPYKAVLD
eukprot:2766384-Heterocapsa_arctica.AAC.1